MNKCNGRNVRLNNVEHPSASVGYLNDVFPENITISLHNDFVTVRLMMILTEKMGPVKPAPQSLRHIITREGGCKQAHFDMCYSYAFINNVFHKFIVH